MKSYLKNYKVRLKTLAPVFIGSGKEISKAEYVFDGRYIYVIDEKRLMDAIIKRNLVEQYTGSMTHNSFNLKMWLDRNNIRDYKALAAYTLSGIENVDDKRSLKGINACVKNAYNEPYIPGSSLKGALRTVILWNLVYDNQDKIKREQHDILAGVKEDRRRIKNAVKKPSERLERRFFNRKTDDADTSIMRGLVVGDSKPLSLDDIILCEKLDVNINGKEKTPNILRECIKPDRKIEFDLSLDSDMLGFDADDFDEMLKNYSADYYSIVSEMFKYKADEENTIYLGGGAGYFSKTVTYSLFDTDTAVNFVREYLSKTTPREHAHYKDRGISPHMQKCTRIGSKVYEMGKCQITIEKT